MSRRAMTAALILTTVIFGWTFVVVRDAVADYSVTGFLAIRFAIGAVILMPLSLHRMTRSTWKIGVGMGGLLALAYWLQTEGLRTTTPTNSGVITGLFVVFVPLFDRLLFRVRIKLGLWLSVLVAMIGVMLLAGAGDLSIGTGDLYTLGCAAGFGLWLSLLSQYAPGHDAIGLAGVQALVTAVIFSVLWPVGDGPEWPSPDVWEALLICGILATALSYALQVKVQQHLSATRTAIILTMEPVFAIGFGYWLGGDRLSPIQWVGATLVLGALINEEIVPRIPARRRSESESGVNEESIEP